MGRFGSIGTIELQSYISLFRNAEGYLYQWLIDIAASGIETAAMNTFTVFQVAIIFTWAGIVKGISGMGLPTLSMALLTFIMPHSNAAALMIFPSLATNAAQCFGPNFRALLASLWPMWLTLLLVTIYSPVPDLSSAGNVAQLSLGSVLVVYGIVGLMRPALPDLRKWARSLGTIAGIFSGFLTASTGVFVMPMVPFLQTQELSKDEMMQALGISFTLATIALALRLGISNATSYTSEPTQSAVSLITALVGLWIGARFRNRLNLLTFRRVLYTVLFLLGSLMIGKSM